MTRSVKTTDFKTKVKCFSTVQETAMCNCVTRGTDEDSKLPGQYVVSIAKYLPTFQGVLLLPSWGQCNKTFAE
jgi:hypothetical protein